MEQLKEIQEFIKKAVDDFKTDFNGCYTYMLDDRLAICVGWLSGYDVNDDDVIHSQTEPEFAVNAGIKVYTSDYMKDDYAFIKMPYYQNGEVLQTDVSISPDFEKDNYKDLAQYLLKEYESMKDLDIDEDGLIHEEASTEEKTEVEEDKSLKESKDIKYDRRAVEKEYNLEDGELDGVSIRDAEEMIGEEEGALDRFIESLTEENDKYYVYLHSPAGTELICSGTKEECEKCKNEKDATWKTGYTWATELTDKPQKEVNLYDSLKEDKEEPKLETYEEQIDFLVKDEDEAIAGYDKVLALVEDENVKEQLQHLKEEEVAHKTFLEKLKTDKTAKYEHEEESEVTDTEEVITNVEESCKVNETFAGEDVIKDLVDRAKMKIDEGEDIDEAVRNAIDEGLIYTKDIYSLLEHYGTIEDSTMIESYYDDLYSDVYNKVTNKDEASDDEEDDDDHFSDDDTIYY